MSEAALIEPAALSVTLPPTQDELPCDDGVPLETERHKLQMDLLIYALKPWLNRQAEGGYVGGNMFMYFSLEQVCNRDFRGPDVFVVLGVPRRERKSWVLWEEGKGPDVVIELLSELVGRAKAPRCPTLPEFVAVHVGCSRARPTGLNGLVT